MADLFTWSPAPVAAPPPFAPDPLPAGDLVQMPAQAGRALWPRTLPTPAHLADPAFRALFDAVRPWWISDDGGRSYGMSAAEHVLVLLDALRAADVIGPPPVPYA